MSRHFELRDMNQPKSTNFERMTLEERTPVIGAGAFRV